MQPPQQYSQNNPHPDLKYVETREWTTPEGKTGKTVWYQCQKCKRYQNSLEHFGWQCAHCKDEDNV